MPATTVKTIVVDQWRGVTSAGVTAAYAAEATATTDNAPTLVQPTIRPARYQERASWMGSATILNKIAQFETTAGGSQVPLRWRTGGCFASRCTRTAP